MVRRLRLASGLVLFAYVASHLANHALGVIGLATMEAGRAWFLAVWRNPLGTVVLYGAFATHIALVLWSLYQRRGLRMPAWEAAQILLGLAIPPLLLTHVLATRLLNSLFGVEDAYAYVVIVTWVWLPEIGIRQMAVLLIAWVHGCMGLHYWLRFRPWYPRALPLLYAAAILLPVLALLGFTHAGQEVAALARDPAWVADLQQRLSLPDETAVAFVDRWTTVGIALYGALIAMVAVARLGREAWERRRGVFHLDYPDGRRVRALAGTSILEVSRAAGIPHASVCGGRGRCSTCRVRVGAGAEHLPPPSADETRVLRRIDAPPNLRLACQTRPHRDLAVVPLLPPTVAPRDALRGAAEAHGNEREIAVVFADLRDFTGLAERKLPYDVVFILNRYFRAMGEAIEGAGGRVDKFIGDGVMALFGIGGDATDGCRRALAGAAAMAAALDKLNVALAGDLDEPLRIGIGIHAGPVILGRLGHGQATALTAIGDTVNTASRLEAMTKTFGCQLVVSRAVETRAGADLSAFARREVSVRGRREPLVVRTVDDARDLGPVIGPGIGSWTRPANPATMRGRESPDLQAQGRQERNRQG